MSANTKTKPVETDPQRLLGSQVSCHFPFPGNPPLFIEPNGARLADDIDAFASWLRERKEVFDQILLSAGALVLRGFKTPETVDFEKVIAPYPNFKQGYSAGGVARGVIHGNVYEATRLPPHKWIMLHQEMAYLPVFPRKLAFYCHVPAEQRGETPIGDMRRLTRLIPDHLRENLERRGVAIVRNFRSPEETSGPRTDPVFGHRTWSEAFFTDDKAKVESDCRERGLRWEWLPDGGINVMLKKDAFLDHPLTGERVWFNTIASNIAHKRWMEEDWDNYAAAYPRGSNRPTHLTYGDDEEIAEDDYLLVHDLMEQVTIRFPWRAGDVMMVDNIYTAHGRSSFVGKRDIQVALLE